MFMSIEVAEAAARHIKEFETMANKDSEPQPIGCFPEVQEHTQVIYKDPCQSCNSNPANNSLASGFCLWTLGNTTVYC